MLVIPAINEIKFEEVLKKINAAGKFSQWIHLDVVDGKFASNITWNNPRDLAGLKHLKSHLEVHLMIENPESVVEDWISSGVKRIIISLEALGGRQLPLLSNRNGNFEIGLAISPETLVEDLLPYLENIKFVLVLGVKPGLAGQKFNEDILEKVRFLKNYYPGVIIEVDGGINLETAKLAKKAGADVIVSASYIWKNQHPERIYKELETI
jgi:ribulose-phosphate 3-epimerase